MDYEGARATAAALATANAGRSIAIRDDLASEHAFGWVFVWWGDDSASGHASRALVGNAPIIVDRRSGRARLTGTAFPLEWYVHAYQELGEERYDAGEWREFILRTFANEF